MASVSNILLFFFFFPPSFVCTYKYIHKKCFHFRICIGLKQVNFKDTSKQWYRLRQSKQLEDCGFSESVNAERWINGFYVIPKNCEWMHQQIKLQQRNIIYLLSSRLYWLKNHVNSNRNKQFQITSLTLEIEPRVLSLKKIYIKI